MKRKILLCALLLACLTLGGKAGAAGIELLPLTPPLPAPEASVPIIMYHLVTENPRYIGKYGITPAMLEDDLRYLQREGYSTVVMADLIDYVHEGVPLPAKPVMLTFDDGNTSDVTYVLPLLEKYDMRAVFSVIGEAADKYTAQRAENPRAKFPNMTWCEIKRLHESGRGEIQSHGYNVHGKNGAGIRRGESDAAYHARLLADLQKLQERCQAELGEVPTTFTYPLGIFSAGTQAVLEELGFVASLSCQEGDNVLKPGERGKLFRLHRVNRPARRGIGELLG